MYLVKSVSLTQQAFLILTFAKRLPLGEENITGIFRVGFLGFHFPKPRLNLCFVRFVHLCPMKSVIRGVAIAFFVAMWANQAQGKFLAYVYGCCKDLGMQHSQAITLTPSLLVEASNNHK
jgi:hypothetical protein